MRWIVNTRNDVKQKIGETHWNHRETNRSAWKRRE